MKYYNEYADEDNLTKFAQSLDSDLIKEIEKEAFQEGKLKSVFSESIDNKAFEDCYPYGYLHQLPPY